MSLDTLSDVLRAVRLRGAVFFAIDGSAPWMAEAPAAREIAPYIMPGVEHVMEYHVVTAGSCWGGIAGEESVRLETGDAIVFPHGDRHVVASAPGMRGTVDYDTYRNARSCPVPMDVRLHGGGEPRATLICGFFGLDARPFNPLLAALPRVLRVPGLGADGGAFTPLVKLALSESSTRQAGSEAVLTRLSELLFVEVVRHHIASLPPGSHGWLAGLRDEGVGRALVELHAAPARDWSLDDLARAAGMSRSVLAERFAELVGVAPMQYLAQWRMQLAATMLSTTSAGVGEIAERVGYASEAAFAKAFKRTVGATPAGWRRGKRAA